MPDTKKKKQRSQILIKGARVHNLKNIDIAIQRNKLTVITGLSGSGKSSLAFDTLYAEGQRRYVESLSSYARQFLGRLDKPDVDNIKGIAPAIAIEQKVNTTNSGSTVGTSTEIYDYLKILFARIGKTFSPVSGKEVKREGVNDVIAYLDEVEDKTKFVIVSPIVPPVGRTLKKQIEILIGQGFSRGYSEGKIIKLESLLNNESIEQQSLDLLIDRLVKKEWDDDAKARLAESIETAFLEGQGTCKVLLFGEDIIERTFSNKFELDGIKFEEPTPIFFAFNNPVGACPTCEGFGQVLGIDPDLVIPDKNLSIYEEAIACWRGEKMSWWNRQLVMNAHKFDFPIHKPVRDLTEEEQQLLWTGNQYFEGLNAFFKEVESQSYKIQFRVLLSRYRGRTDCSDCKGTRLRKDAGYVKVGGYSITDITSVSIDEALQRIKKLNISDRDKFIAKQLLIEIETRLQFLSDVGLGYLTLSRKSNTLSGGESQRINLATSLGSSLVGAMYILDEPSIGLHPRDTQRLLKVLLALRDVGNTVIVVEHDEEIMQTADEIIDMGPYAGTFGGEVVFQGRLDELKTAENSITAQYLTGERKIEIPSSRRAWNKSIILTGAEQNNIHNLDVEIPLECLTVVTGVSGSGKSTLVKQILYPAIKKVIEGTSFLTKNYAALKGDWKDIKKIEFVDQNPIGKSSRSNPVTYVKAYDEIRALFAQQPLSVVNGFTPKYFSFNVPGGRCDACEGEGQITVSMQFMADVHLECEICKGRRFKDDVLEVNYRGKNIYEVLTMTIDDAIDFFAQNLGKQEQKIITKLKPLQDVGLGYVQLGQAGNTLSGGEAQRIKLASFLSRKNNPAKTLFIFDEPTTGLHFHDIDKLLTAIYSLLDLGHSVLIIEHNMEIIKCADWIIDMGKEGGDQGGNITFAGTPEALAQHKESYTAKYLKEKLNHV